MANAAPACFDKGSSVLNCGCHDFRPPQGLLPHRMRIAAAISQRACYTHREPGTRARAQLRLPPGQASAGGTRLTKGRQPTADAPSRTQAGALRRTSYAPHTARGPTTPGAGTACRSGVSPGLPFRTEYTAAWCSQAGRGAHVLAKRGGSGGGWRRLRRRKSLASTCGGPRGRKRRRTSMRAADAAGSSATAALGTARARARAPDGAC